MLPSTLQPLCQAADGFWWNARIHWPACMNHEVLLFTGDGCPLFACKVLDKDQPGGPTQFMLDPEHPPEPRYRALFHDAINDPPVFGVEVIRWVLLSSRRIENAKFTIRGGGIPTEALEKYTRLQAEPLPDLRGSP